jgi:hypothetical protein
MEPWLADKLKLVLAMPQASAGRAFHHPYLFRAMLYAAGLFIFLIFDDQDRQFIYFQF